MPPGEISKGTIQYSMHISFPVVMAYTVVAVRSRIRIHQKERKQQLPDLSTCFKQSRIFVHTTICRLRIMSYVMLQPQPNTHVAPFTNMV